MTIDLAAGEQRELNIQLTPIPSVQLAITELFVGTRAYGYKNTSDDRIYVRVKNEGQVGLPVSCYIYDWQAWWGQPVGDDRRWRKSATIPAGGYYVFSQQISHLNNDTTYFRVELLVNDVVVVSVPPFYIIPGKICTTCIDSAAGACTYKAPGMVILWYSQDSECQIWDGRYKYPPAQYGSSVYHKSFSFRTRDNRWWPAVFIPIFDENLTPTQIWEAYFSGGGAGTCWRECWFTFTPA